MFICSKTTSAKSHAVVLTVRIEVILAIEYHILLQIVSSSHWFHWWMRTQLSIKRGQGFVWRMHWKNQFYL